MEPFRQRDHSAWVGGQIPQQVNLLEASKRKVNREVVNPWGEISDHSGVCCLFCFFPMKLRGFLSASKEKFPAA